MNTTELPNEEDDLLLAEYALGVLEQVDRQRLESRLAQQPALRERLEQWHEHLAPMLQDFPAHTPPEYVWARIRQSLGQDITARRHAAPEPTTGFWDSLQVWRWGTFGGLAAVHHYATVGESAFIGGMTRISLDVPPYMLVEGSPMKVWSINKVGLRRHGFSSESMENLKEAHRCLYREGYSRVEAVKILKDRLWDCPKVQNLVNFLDRADQGHKGRARQPSSE